MNTDMLSTRLADDPALRAGPSSGGSRQYILRQRGQCGEVESPTPQLPGSIG